LSDADLHRATLSDANFSGANLSSADLSSAEISGANLSGANLKDTILDKANLRHAEGIIKEELEEQAGSLEGTIMPDGSKHP